MVNWTDFFGGASRRAAYDAVQANLARGIAERCAEYDAFARPARRVAKGGLTLGVARTSTGKRVPIHLAPGAEGGHLVAVGGTGSGKTSVISGAWLPQRYSLPRPAVGSVDLKGDSHHLGLRFWAQISALCPTAQERETRRVRPVIVDLSAPNIQPFNVFRLFPGETAGARASDVTLALDRYFGSVLGNHQESILRYGCHLAIEHGLTLPDLVRIYEDEVFRGLLAMQSANREVKEYFLKTWHTATPDASKSSVISRLRGLLHAESLRLALSADRIVDLPGILERGDPLFVYCGRGPNLPEEESQTIASLFIQLFLSAAYNRGTGQKERFVITLDEVGRLVEAPAMQDRLASALSLARTYGVAVWLIFQFFAQLGRKFRESIVGNIDMAAIFKTTRDNIVPFGDFLPSVDPESVRQAFAEERDRLSHAEMQRRQIESIQRLKQGSLMFYDRRQSHRAIRLRVPKAALPHELMGMSEGAFERWFHDEGWDLGGGGLSRAAIEGEIAARERRLMERLRPTIVLNTKPEPSRETPVKNRSKKKPQLG